MAQNIHSVLQLQLEYSHCPTVLDLSGEHSFDALLKVRRTHTDTDPRPITLLTTGSVFDPRTAFKDGYLKLIEARKNGKGISMQGESENDRTGESENIVPIEEAPEGSYVTLPSRAGGRGDLQKRAHFDVVIRLRIAEHFRDQLVPGRTYNIKTTSGSLEIKWWSYGAKENLPKPLPSSESAKLSAKDIGGRVNFLVVNSLTPPPSISVSFSLSSSIVRRADDPPPTLRIEVTNRSEKPVTLKTSGDQIYIKPDNGGLLQPYPYRSIVDPSPHLENFCINRVPSGEDCIHPRVMNVSCVGPSGWWRQSFVTLPPDEPLIREIPFLQGANGVRERMGGDGEFRLKLRDAGLWWFEGTVEDMFGKDTFIKTLPNNRTLPIIPRGENEVTFRLESQM